MSSSTIDWERVAEPQADGYDARVALHLAATRPTPGLRELFVPPPPAPGPRILDGVVPVGRWYTAPEVAPHVDAPLDHPSIEGAVELLRSWQSGFRMVQSLLLGFHPLEETRQPDDDGPSSTRSCSSLSSRRQPFILAATVGHPLPLALAFLRHTSYSKLSALGIGASATSALLINPVSERFECKVRGRKRPLAGIFHDTFAATSELDLLVRLRSDPTAAPAGSLPDAALHERGSLDEEQLELIERNARTDEEGARFLRGFLVWARRVSRGALRAAQQRGESR